MVLTLVGLGTLAYSTPQLMPRLGLAAAGVVVVAAARREGLDLRDRGFNLAVLAIVAGIGFWGVVGWYLFFR